MSGLLGKVRNCWMNDSSGIFCKQGKKTYVANGMGEFKQEMKIKIGHQEKMFREKRKNVYVYLPVGRVPGNLRDSRTLA